MLLTAARVLSCVLAMSETEAPPQSSNGCDVRVKKSYTALRFREAADEAERCWKESGDKRLLLDAAQARANLHHRAHAMIHLVRYVRGDSEARRAHASLYAQYREQVVSVEVVISPTPSDGEVVAVYLGENRGEIRVPLDELRASESQLLLDRGRWRLAWREGDRMVVFKDIEAVEGLSVVLEVPQAPIDEVRPAPEVPRWPTDLTRSQKRARTGVALGVGSAAALSIGAGLGLVGHSARMEGTLKADATEEANRGASIQIADRAMFAWNGGVAIGAGVGGVVVVATELARAKRPVLIAEVGVGAAAVIAAAAWSAVNTAGYDAMTTRYHDGGVVPGDQVFRARYSQDLGSGMLLGLGSGLVTGAAISLISRAVVERRRR